MELMKCLSSAVIMIFIFCAVSCAFDGKLKDGVFEGEYSFIKVLVTVSEGKVEDIKMVDHGGGGAKYAAMVEPLLARMVSGQTTDVDAVTGATVSSVNLRNAVENALSKASGV